MNGRKNRTPGSIGGETLTRLAVSAALLTLAACGGGGGDDAEQALDLSNLQEVPEVAAANPGEISANTDVAETVAGDPVIVSILRNDSFAADAQIQLVGQPKNGQATLLENGDVEYIADSDFEGTDTVEYVLVDADGNQSTGTLYIAVVCADCAIVPNVAAAEIDNPNNYPFCLASNPDPDGDGYGWEDLETCLVPALGAAMDPLAAKADTVNIDAGSTVAISPLRNDSIADRSNVEFSIDVQPTVGRIEAAEAGILVYAAPQSYSGADSLIYSIKDIEGNTSVASVDINVTCAFCVDYKGLKLSWPANPEAEGVDGYRIFFGSDENPLTATMVSQVNTTALGDIPAVVFDLAADLNVSASEGGCFMVQAYRGAEVSEHSEAACFTRG